MTGLKALLDKFGILRRLKSCARKCIRSHVLLGLFDVEGRKKDLGGCLRGDCLARIPSKSFLQFEKLLEEMFMTHRWSL